MPKSRRVGAIKCKKHFKIMKPNRFILLFSLLLAANAVAYFYSCRQDEAASLTPKPTGDIPVTYRACLDDDYCSYVIQATTNCTVDLCGDVLGAVNACTVGCGSFGADLSKTVQLTANTPYTFCVYETGSVCVFNPGMADITVSVNVAGVGGYNNVPIPSGMRECFSSDADCSLTSDDCY